MENTPLSALKNELKLLPHERLTELCIKFAKYKKENKEFLAYLLFDSANEKGYVLNIKEDMNLEFSKLSGLFPRPYLNAVKKIYRNTEKYIHFSGSKETEIDLLLHFCQLIRKNYPRSFRNPSLETFYLRISKRIRKVYEQLHEDLRFDYEEEVGKL